MNVLKNVMVGFVCAQAIVVSVSQCAFESAAAGAEVAVFGDSSGGEEMEEQDPVDLMFEAAIKRADVKTIGELLVCNPELAHKNLVSSGEPPVVYAAGCGRTNVIRLLLDAKANPNAARKEDDVTALLIASSGGYVPMAQLLIERNASVTQCDKEGRFPLLLACTNSNKDIRELLLSNGANVNQKSKTGSTALRAACTEGNEEGVRVLLEAKADVNAMSEGGYTSLRIVTGKSLGIVELLLAAKAEPDKTDEGSDTPLIWAVIHEHTPIVKALLLAKANPTITNAHDCGALYYASKNPEIYAMLESAMQEQALALSMQEHSGEEAKDGAA